MPDLESLYGDEPRIFGPGTDLVISLVAVLLLVLVMGSALHEEEIAKLEEERRRIAQQIVQLEAEITELREQRDRLERERRRLARELEEFRTGQVDLEEVLANQRDLVDSVAAQFEGAEAYPVGEATYALAITDRSSRGSPDIVFSNDVTLQRITFGSHILFPPDGVELSRDGRELLRRFARGLELELEHLREIHIQGHADPTPTERYDSNLQLAALRAVSVFRALEEYGVSPFEVVMSATSFGEFLSVERFRSGRAYSRRQLDRDNRTRAQKRRNRRIELLLLYRRPH